MDVDSITGNGQGLNLRGTLWDYYPALRAIVIEFYDLTVWSVSV
jgi:hypothetical protein